MALLPSSLPYMCMIHSTWISTLCICCIVHMYRQVPGGLEQTARFALETAFPECTLPPRQERRSACVHAEFGLLLPCFKPSCDAEKRLLYTVLCLRTWGLPTCFASTKGLEGLQVCLCCLQNTTTWLDRINHQLKPARTLLLLSHPSLLYLLTYSSSVSGLDPTCSNIDCRILQRRLQCHINVCAIDVSVSDSLAGTVQKP